MTDFAFTELLPLGHDDTPYRLVSTDGVAVVDTPLGRRRTDFSEAPEIDLELEQSMIEKEPVTVVCSEKGWIRAWAWRMLPSGSRESP
mgnify:CR=1 FL=1